MKLSHSIISIVFYLIITLPTQCMDDYTKELLIQGCTNSVLDENTINMVFINAAEKDLKKILDTYSDEQLANITCSDNGSNLLIESCKYGHPIYRYLLKGRNMKINAADQDGVTPLYGALENKQGSCALDLLAHGADATIVAHEEYSPAHLAFLTGNIPFVQALLQKGFTYEAIKPPATFMPFPFHFLAFAGHTDMIKLYALQGYDVWTKNQDDKVPLHRALEKDHRDTVCFLAQTLSPATRCTNCAQLLNTQNMYYGLTKKCTHFFCLKCCDTFEPHLERHKNDDPCYLCTKIAREKKARESYQPLSPRANPVSRNSKHQLLAHNDSPRTLIGINHNAQDVDSLEPLDGQTHTPEFRARTGSMLDDKNLTTPQENHCRERGYSILED